MAAEEIMDRGLRRYLRGDYGAAIEDFSRVLEIEENERALRMLRNSLVEEGRIRISRGEYERAVELLSRAQEISHSREAQDLIEDAKEQIAPPPTPQPAPAPAPPAPDRGRIDELQAALRSERQASAALRSRINALDQNNSALQSRLDDAAADLREAEKRIDELREEAEGGRRSLLLIALSGGAGALVVGIIIIIILKKVYFTASSGTYQIEELEEKISGRLREAEKESEELEEKVARSINQMIDGQKTVVKQLSLSAGGKTQQDLEEIKDNLQKHFDNQQERLIDLLHQQSKAISNEKSEKVELPSGRVITDVNPHIRARADSVELIPKTVSDPSVAEKMLRPYLSDPNNRVRGNAAREIHRYNPSLAHDALEKMAASGDKWMRLSAAWAIGEIGTPEMVHILRDLLDDVDDRVRDRAVKAFESIAEVKDDISDEIRRMIDQQKKRGGGEN